MSTGVASKLFRLSALFLLVVGLHPAWAQMATPVRTADAACSACHQEIVRSYLQTPMANASGLAAERVVPGAVRQVRSGVDYKISIQPDGPSLSYVLPGPVSGSRKLDYFLGSGHLGTTYLYSVDRYLFESPVAWYRKSYAYDMKPGYETSSTMPPGLALNDGCLRCHMSAVERPDPGTENRYATLPFQHVGITCEGCHGDTRAHVATGGASKLVAIAQLPPARRDSICINCHLEGDANVERAGRSLLDFRPGDDIGEYVAYFAFAGADRTSRAVSEIEQFTTSKCKLVSGPAMSCLNCHDPHSTPQPAQQAAFYRAKCLSCHQQPEFATHHADTPDCTSCHMPKTGAQNIDHVAWTDHRIRKVPDPVALASMPHALRDLQPMLSRDSNDRDLGLAYYNLVAKGMNEEKGRATQLLVAANRSGPKDVAVLRALGVLSQMDGRDTEAEAYYRSILKVEPANVTAATNLGVLLAQRGQLAEAARLWELPFQANQDRVDLGTDLAIVQCTLGEKARAVAILRQVLTYSPDLRQVRSRLTAMENGQLPCVAAQ